MTFDVWLFGGEPPCRERTIELRIAHFRFTPAPDAVLVTARRRQSRSGGGRNVGGEAAELRR